MILHGRHFDTLQRIHGGLRQAAANKPICGTHYWIAAKDSSKNMRNETKLSGDPEILVLGSFGYSSVFTKYRAARTTIFVVVVMTANDGDESLPQHWDVPERAITF